MSYYRRRYHNRPERYYSPKYTRPKLNDSDKSWEPLPAWEKKFCIKVGAMPWKKFVESKNNLLKTDKVFEWDDSAEYYHRFPCTNKLPSNAADMYIDDIDWNSKIDPKLFLEIKSISDDEEEEEEEEVKRIDSFSIPLEQIKATGWEYDEATSRLPTIVGS
ncbi:hypothetical protein ES319_D03G189500v1 [Gossypium barbadense]|uniref:Uncharacterized protein n=2 Tax=Gossypium TaxID=3633 RepID=A0A5J5S6H8_GOSBA|nr:hypothetical protein ES319_D03G189500v1 [Gossypium barbadense]TYG77526.1 hypothetical protein ES288_D03G202000v1 [Gossypium darwinii]